MIEVRETGTGDPMTFTVKVKEGGSHTTHNVTMSMALYKDLTGGKITPRRCMEAAFEYLLDRESKESILSSFDITVISRYFPRFRSEFGQYIPS